MKFFLACFLLPALSIAQNSDWKELQGKIDSAIQVNGIVEVRRNYTIDRPLVAAKWNGKDYTFFTIQIKGEATMWDVGNRSVIKVTFKDAPALSIHKAKGVLVQGINFQGQFSSPKLSPEELYVSELKDYGDPTCRDSRFSPYCAIAIDPFMYEPPSDGGYPPLKSYYRGSKSKGGSTGIRIEDCTFNAFTVGAITSPNGHTQNAELITFQNIRIGNCKIGIAGTQPQEKLNRAINIGAWGITHTLFGFNQYGEAKPGHWVIDGVNIAGNVVQLVHRHSHGYFPLYISNVFAESLGRIGEWETLLSDRLDNSVINFRYADQTNGFPDFALSQPGLTISNSTLRYYGQKLPIVFADSVRLENVNFDNNYPIFSKRKDQKNIRNLGNFKVVVNNRKMEVQAKAQPGEIIVFYEMNNVFAGYGTVESVNGSSITIGKLSASIKSGKSYKIGLFTPEKGKAAERQQQ